MLYKLSVLIFQLAGRQKCYFIEQLMCVERTFIILENLFFPLRKLLLLESFPQEIYTPNFARKQKNFLKFSSFSRETKDFS